MTASARIPITGIGIVAPGAIGIEAFRQLLNSGRSTIGAIARFDTTGLNAHRAALITGFNAKDFIAPMKMRRMNTLSRYAMAAARMALDDAGHALAPETGVAMGTSFGPVQTSVDYMAEYIEKGATLAPPQLFAESVANAPGSHVAIEWGLRGFNVTVTQRETSAALAAMYGCAQLLKGTVKSALLGGIEEVNEMVFSVLDRLGALAHADGEIDETARPFDRRRNGLVIGEGSAVFVVEAEAEAKYGYLAGFGMSRDTTASISDWGDDPASVVTAMRAALDDAELEPGEIDAVYASANSTARADRLEYRAIQDLFAERIPPVVATKGYFGEYAAGGGLHLASALIAVRDQMLHASMGFAEGEPEMHFTPVLAARPQAVRNILVNAIGAGGGIVSIVVSREAS